LWIVLTVPLILSLLGLNTIEVSAAATHDIAVISVKPSPTLVRKGELVNITVVVENQGTENETFDVTAYYDATAIENKTVTSLENGTSTTLTFTWDTTDITAGNYAINATASTVPDETETEDNTLASPTPVKVISQYIAVIPQRTVDTTLTPGKNYTVSIYTDYNGTDVWSYEFSLTYNPNVLEGINVTNGDLITKEKDSSAEFLPGDFNNTKGELETTGAVFITYTLPVPLTSGPGILANVTFRVVGTGESNVTLGLYDTRLVGVTEDGYGEKYNIISLSKPELGHLLFGYFRNTAGAVTHDIAVTNVTPSLTLVEAGEPVDIVVVVENQGTVVETFDVQVYYKYMPGFPGTNLIGTQTVTSLENGTSTTLTFTWDTTDITAGNYTITALALGLSGETDKEDNKIESIETVTVKVREEQPLPIELIIGIVVVVVAIAVVVYAVRRRKKPISV